MYGLEEIVEMNKPKELPAPSVPAGSFLTILLPEHRDYDELAHEVQTILLDVFGPHAAWDAARIEGHGGVMVATNTWEATQQEVNDVLVRVAERYQIPAIFWVFGDLQSAEVDRG
jgi:hypothetical protein